MQSAILLIQCPDTAGIVAKLSNWVFQQGANIIRSDQYSTDPSGGQFFMRLEFYFDVAQHSIESLRDGFTALGETLKATWSIREKSDKLRMGILVSQHDHCLYDLLYHWRSQEIDADIACIISNHPDSKDIAKMHGIPFYHLPVNADTKAQQENDVLKLVQDKTDFLVLARYMQILSADFLQRYNKDIINIHHSFLPSFIGANPYRQAYERGVKIIGATAHYVTEILDDGPIIEQMVERVSHLDCPNSLKRKGKHIEKRTLLKAVAAHSEHRVIRYGNKTIVFE